ncbi:MAG: PAS domain S-box protein [Desulfovibrio sp.]|nr:PAS domain S-box protein [Desulfovibrio sp.]MBI4961230.1 PAS domain S-box protein [Desulfovibrio sp.]
MRDHEKTKEQLIAELQDAQALIAELSTCGFEQARTERVLQARSRLMLLSSTCALERLLVATLDEAEMLTESQIGFFHFLKRDQKTLSLQAWSTNTTRTMCKAEGKGAHYSVAQAGVWTDCIHKGQAVIHNDYPSLAHKKGLPAGHAPIIRELVVPVFRLNKIVAILGVGNKACDYTENDIESVAQLADLAWDLAERKRAEEALKKAHDGLENRVEKRTKALIRANKALDKVITQRKWAEEALKKSEKRFRELVEGTDNLVTQADASGRFLYVNPAAARSFGLTPEECMGLSAFDFIHEEDREATWNAFKGWVTDRLSHVTIENRHVSQHGEVRHMSWTVELHYDEEGNVSSVDSIGRDTTEHKRLEEALKENEERFRLLVELAPEAIIVDDIDSHQIIVANKNALSLFATSREDLLKNGVFRFYADKQPDGRPKEETIQRNVMKIKAGEAVRVERAIRNAAGQDLLCEVWLVKLVMNGRETVRSSWTDITERKRVERDLARHRALLHSIIEGTTDAVFAKDLEGRYLLANSEVGRMVGKPVEEIIGRKDTDHFSPDDAAKVMGRDRIVRGTGATLNYEEVLTTTRGHRNLLCLKSPLRDESGEITGVFGITRDITELKRMQEVLVQTEKMMSVGGLAAGMAHEINNPLSGILQGTQVLLGRVKKDTQRNRAVAKEAGTSLETIQDYMQRRGLLPIIESMRESAERAARIVQGMLSFSRQQDSNTELEDVAELLDKALALCESDYDLSKKYDFRHIAITRDYQPGIAPVRCSASLVEQVVMNILRNAAQAMAAEGSGSHAPAITLATWQEGPHVVISIADNGPGMDESTRKRVFEPFFTTKKPGTGTGLGLSVSYFIVTDNLGGTIEVDSAPGRGTRFVIRLPHARTSGSRDRTKAPAS